MWVRHVGTSIKVHSEARRDTNRCLLMNNGHRGKGRTLYGDAVTGIYSFGRNIAGISARVSAWFWAGSVAGWWLGWCLGLVAAAVPPCPGGEDEDEGGASTSEEVTEEEVAVEEDRASQAYSTARAWFPVDAVTTPRAKASGGRDSSCKGPGTLAGLAHHVICCAGFGFESLQSSTGAKSSVCGV